MIKDRKLVFWASRENVTRTLNWTREHAYTENLSVKNTLAISDVLPIKSKNQL